MQPGGYLWYTWDDMRIMKPKNPGVYVQFQDRRRRIKSECLTVPELTPKQAMREFAKFLRQRLRPTRKAG